MFPTITRIVSNAAATAFNSLFYYLHNRTNLAFTREEIRYAKVTFSQFGEDLAVLRWMDELSIEKGIYLDVGAFHPVHLSNTLLLFKKGWKGVNIDMNCEKINAFDNQRPQDENVCVAIAIEGRCFAVENKGCPTERLCEIPQDDSVSGEMVRGSSLAAVLRSTKLGNARIHYINIDCEGHDFDVLQQVEFAVQDPCVITIEALDAVSQSAICRFLESKGYALRDKMHWTLLFTKADAAPHLPFLNQTMEAMSEPPHNHQRIGEYPCCDVL